MSKVKTFVLTLGHKVLFAYFNWTTYIRPTGSS